jgi:Zn-dependent M28 family amino/carboxypeptidase
LVAADGDLTDAAALFFSDDGSRAEQFIAAGTGGAAVMIRVTEDLAEDGSPLVEVGHTFATSTLPSMALAADAIELIQDAVGEWVTLELDSERIPDHVSTNVAATMAGSSGRTVYLVAHHDSWHLSESAMDNAMGVGMMALLAQQTALAQPDSDVVFLATAGEEQGLQGAQAWTAEHDEEIRLRGDLVITLDIPWSHEGPMRCSADDPVLLARAVEIGAEEGIEITAGGSLSPASDHVPFQARGLPGLWCQRYPDRHYHTAMDTLDWLDMDAAFAVWRLHARLLAEVSGADEDRMLGG